jgi:AcrR family transcriptional regulator
MAASGVQAARARAVEEQVLTGVASLLERGEDLTFAKVAQAAEVPERTVYRYFPNRNALLAAAYQAANRRIGFEGSRPTSVDGLADLIRRAFPVFDDLAPVVNELLVAPEGRAARLADGQARRDAFLTLVRTEAPSLDAVTTRRIAAVVQVLGSAASWQALREHWDFDGAEAAEAAVLAVRLLMDGARQC